MNTNLNNEIMAHWKQLRSMTYNFINLIKDKDLKCKLPFPQSQTLGYQFSCMVGAQESNMALITKGKWEGFSCSLDKVEKITQKIIIKHMQEADKVLYQVLADIDLLQKFPDGSTSLMNYEILTEHEAHHQGQIINFIFACDLPIPQSWADKWALSRD